MAGSGGWGRGMGTQTHTHTHSLSLSQLRLLKNTNVGAKRHFKKITICPHRCFAYGIYDNKKRKKDDEENDADDSCL